MCELGRGGVSLTSMAERTLGRGGTVAAGAAYVFLHYALLVAYLSRAGDILGGELGVPPAVSTVGFMAALTSVCFFSSASRLDQVNAVLVAGVVGSFLFLLALAAPGVDPGALAKADWGAVPDALPVVALAFVFHNVVPVIASSLEGDTRKIRNAILLGTGVPFAMFAAWDGAILGRSAELLDGRDGADLLMLLAQTDPAVGPGIQAFSLLAIATSYIGFVLGLTDFLADALRLPTGSKNAGVYALTVLPPTVFALWKPDVFISAVDTAGTFGVLVLFGIVPATMAWGERYTEGRTLATSRLVPGGRAALLAIGGLASAVIARETLQLVLPAS